MVRVIRSERTAASNRLRDRSSREHTPDSIVQLCGQLPPVVYFIRTQDGLVKIGHTTNLAQRKRHFGSGWEHILAVVPGTREDEAAMHQRFADDLAHGREYFHASPALLAYVNEIRAQLGVSALAA